MKIYLVERNEFDKSGGYDTFVNFTAYAPDENTVKNMDPNFDKKYKIIIWNEIENDIYWNWVKDPNHLRITYLGENSNEIDIKIINYYFHHG